MTSALVPPLLVQVWLQPSQRANHRVAYHEGLGLMVLYGGDSYEVDQLAKTNVTYLTTVEADLWVYNIRECARYRRPELYE